MSVIYFEILAHILKSRAQVKDGQGVCVVGVFIVNHGCTYVFYFKRKKRLFLRELLKIYNP